MSQDLDSLVADIQSLIQRANERSAEDIAALGQMSERLAAIKAGVLTGGLKPIDDGSRSAQPKTVDAFAKLPWKTNRRGEWAFADDPAFKELAAKIGPQKGNRFIDGGFEYAITVGDNGKRFINRSRSR